MVIMQCTKCGAHYQGGRDVFDAVVFSHEKTTGHNHWEEKYVDDAQNSIKPIPWKIQAPTEPIKKKVGRPKKSAHRIKVRKQ